MPVLTAVYLDLQCPSSLRAWRWLRALPGGPPDVRPYWQSPGGPRVQPWDAEEPSWSLDLLALGECARDQGGRVHREYVDAALHAVHVEKLDVSTPEGLGELAARASLLLGAFAAERERWRAEVGLHHREAEDDFGVFATPALVFDDDRAVQVRLVGDVGEASAAQQLLDDVADLTRNPSRSRGARPDRRGVAATMRPQPLSPVTKG
ncbi:MAG: hypothetical protein M3N17_01580 [Actinomycetota bacterium]|nr:hypothetical protein [Actinomycetota bacterium]